MQIAHLFSISLSTVVHVVIELLLKRVVVSMSDSDAAALKLYCNKWNMTLSNALVEMARSHIHGSAAICTFARDLLNNEDIALDKRAHKQCFGFKCRCCAYSTACRCGLYPGEWVIDKRHKHLLIKQDPKEQWFSLYIRSTHNDPLLWQSFPLARSI